MKVIIASKNPVKINCVKIGFEKMLLNQDFEFEGISAPSDISDQPMTDQESLLGAKNRANNAMNLMPQADYWVGVEGGVQKVKSEMQCFAWVFIKSKNNEGKARSGTFYLPKKVVELVEQDKELGEADDIVFGRINSKQQNGAVGLLTGDVIDRVELYVQAVVLALIPFKNKDLY